MPSPREIEWLQQLAKGIPVAQLADRAGYSERAMYRLLRGLYTKTGREDSNGGADARAGARLVVDDAMRLLSDRSS